MKQKSLFFCSSGLMLYDLSQGRRRDYTYSITVVEQENGLFIIGKASAVEQIRQRYGSDMVLRYPSLSLYSHCGPEFCNSPTSSQAHKLSSSLE